MGVGKFIVVEGIDGCGKTSTLKTLQLRCWPAGVWFTAEPFVPGYSNVAEAFAFAAPLTQLHLHLADRHHHNPFIQVCLDDGTHVVCDRYTPSTRVYQREVLHQHPVLYDAVQLAHREPDAYVYLRVSAATAVARMLARDPMEQIPTSHELERRVSRYDAEFDWQAKEGKRLGLAAVHVIDAEQPATVVAAELEQILAGYFREG